MAAYTLPFIKYWMNRLDLVLVNPYIQCLPRAILAEISSMKPVTTVCCMSLLSVFDQFTRRMFLKPYLGEEYPKEQSFQQWTAYYK